MLKRHFSSAGTYIKYGKATGLFPIDELNAAVLQHRDAELALNAVDGRDVILIAPTSLATSYLLTQHALTAITIDSLPVGARSQIDAELDEPIDTFEIVQIGKWNSSNPNHSLAEFVNA